MGTEWQWRLVRAAVLDVFEPAARGDVIVVDCNDLPSAQAAGFAGHAGTHGDYMLWLTRQPFFAHCFWSVALELRRARRSGAVHAAVAVVDYSGKEQSVALAVLLKAAISQQPDLQLLEVVHTSPLAEVARCGLCAACDCGLRNDARGLAICAAWRIWGEVRDRPDPEEGA
jgi:hypothetical protein